MMLESIIGRCRCDKCGNAFQVDIDPAVKPMRGWAVYEIVEDAVRGSDTSAVRDGQWLCEACELADRSTGN